MIKYSNATSLITTPSIFLTSKDSVPTLEYLIPDLIPYRQDGKVGLLFGSTGIGKTLISIDIACRIATGLDFAGKPTKKGGVVYVCAESAFGVLDRINAWEKFNNISTSENLLLCTESMVLTSDENVNVLETAMQRHFVNAPPVLLIIDTLNLCFDGDENHTKDMTRLFQSAYSFAYRNKITVMFVHHNTKTNQNEPRGNSVITCNADFRFMISENKKDTKTLRTLSVQKQRDGRNDINITFKMDWEVNFIKNNELRTAPVATPLGSIN